MAGYILRGEEKSVVIPAAQADLLLQSGHGDAALLYLALQRLDRGVTEDELCGKLNMTALHLAAVFVYTTLEFLSVEWIARIYTDDKEVMTIIANFMMYGIVWQFFDAVGSPLQGILRGYKDVKFTFLISVFPNFVDAT